ncbi:MAG: DUF1223 domain-containing protein [Pseudomonadota bacterium]
MAAGSLALLAGASHPAAAQKAVVELFTSQGCSSCPPADKLLSQYAERRDIVALSFNVDYWDYLGWKDTLAKKAFTKRQRSYAKFRGDGAVYTPQVVVNGRQHVVGSDSVAIAAALRETQAKMSDAPDLTVERNGTKFRVTIGASANRKGRKATVWIATVTRKVKVPIQHGENRNRVITYHNVVRDLMPVGTWTGDTQTLELDARLMTHGGAEHCAIIIQAGSTGPILTADWLDR